MKHFLPVKKHILTKIRQNYNKPLPNWPSSK